jgi:S1-C subfamily serine protease
MLKVRKGGPAARTVLRFAPGDTVSLDVMRGDESVTLEATLGERPADLS